MVSHKLICPHSVQVTVSRSVRAVTLLTSRGLPDSNVGRRISSSGVFLGTSLQMPLKQAYFKLTLQRLTLIYIICILQIQYAPHREHHVSVNSTSRLMLYGKVKAVHRQHHTEYINICGEKCRVLSDLAVNIIHHWGGGTKIPGFRQQNFYYSGFQYLQILIMYRDLFHLSSKLNCEVAFRFYFENL